MWPPPNGMTGSNAPGFPPNFDLRAQSPSMGQTATQQPQGLINIPNGAPHGFQFGMQNSTGLYNEQAFLENQLGNPQIPFPSSPFLPSPQSMNITPQTSLPTPISVKAAELKAKLLKSKAGRASSAPSLNAPAAATHITAGKAARRTQVASDLEIQELISELSGNVQDATKAPATDGARKEAKIERQHSHQTETTDIQHLTMKSQAQSRISNNTPRSNGDMTLIENREPAQGETNGNIVHSPDPDSEVSEGEIREDLERPFQVTSAPPQPNRNPAKKHEQDTSRAFPSRTRESPRPVNEPGSLASRIVVPNMNSQSQNGRPKSAKEERRQSRDDTGDRRDVPLQDAPRGPKTGRQDSKRNGDQNPESKDDKVKADSKLASPPILAQLLLQDADLKEWLDITGYHNEKYRKDILHQRRELAAVAKQEAAMIAQQDALAKRKARLLALMKARKPPTPDLVQPLAMAGLEERVITQTDTSQKPKATPAPSNKRPYSEFDDTGGDHDVQRNIRPASRGTKFSRDDENDRSRPTWDYDHAELRPHSLDRREFSRGGGYEGGRGRGSAYSREMSPSQRAYESRYGRNYESGSDDSFERDHLHFNEYRGNYRGKSFDPNRARGRGRGGRGGRGRGH